MKRKIIFLNIFLFLGLALAFSAKAFCPVCVIAIAGGVGLSRWLKIDDVISGLWIGALLLSLTMWTVVWLNKKNIKFFLRPILVAVFWYLITIIPLYWAGIMGHPLNKLFGMDKLLLGTILGTIIFGIAVILHETLKKYNQDKSYFPYQKVVVPVSLLLISSLIIYLLYLWKII